MSGLRDRERGQGPIGRLLGLAGAGVQKANEYRENRAQQAQSRESSQQDSNVTAGPSHSRPQPSPQAAPPPSDLPPAYDDVAGERSGPPRPSRKPVSENLGVLSQYDDEEYDSNSDDDLDSIEDDEEDWELDEITDTSEGLPFHEGSEKNDGNIDELIREVINKAAPGLSSGEPFDRQPLPCPVIVPQRRTRSKANGFVRAYAPLLGEYSGIDQETFLVFMGNLAKSCQTSPMVNVINIAALPLVTAQAVSHAQVASEMEDPQQRTNTFLDRINDQLFKPAGLYAMIVKHKKDQSEKSLLSRLGVDSEKVDFNTYGESQSMGEKMRNLQLESRANASELSFPEAAPLVFPDIDKAVEKEGPETVINKAKGAKSVLADYLDRTAQMQHVPRDNPTSTLAVPAAQSAFNTQPADPNYPDTQRGTVGDPEYNRTVPEEQYQGGRGGPLSGGLLSRGSGDGICDRRRRRDKREKRIEKYQRRIDQGRGLGRKKQQRYDRYLAQQGGTYGADPNFAPQDRGLIGFVGRRVAMGMIRRGVGRFAHSGRGGRYDDQGHQNYGDGSGHGRRGRRGGLLGRGGRRGGLLGRGGRRGRRGRGGGPLGRVEGMIGNAIGGLSGQSSQSGYGGRSREFEDANSSTRQENAYDDPSVQRRSYDDRAYGNEQDQYGYAGPAGQYDDGQSGYDQNEQYGPGEHDSPAYSGDQIPQGGPSFTVKRIMREGVLYLMIVNMPSGPELSEAREVRQSEGGN